jgi:hypothetical protein
MPPQLQTLLLQIVKIAQQVSGLVSGRTRSQIAIFTPTAAIQHLVVLHCGLSIQTMPRTAWQAPAAHLGPRPGRTRTKLTLRQRQISRGVNPGL